MRSFAREAAKLTAALARADRIAEVLTEDDFIKDGTYRGPRARGEVELENVTLQLPATVTRSTLSTSSSRPASGVALTGPSGAGKSTLASLVARFYDPTEGRVLIDGRDARDCTLEWLRDQIAVVLQDTVLFTGTVRDNIAYGTDAIMRGHRAGRHGPPPPMTSSRSSPTATTPSSDPRERGSPAASASAWASPARCCATRRSSSSTSPRRRSTRTQKARSWTAWTA